MAPISVLYERLQIMPQLRLHQLRVAAVGKLLCDHFLEPVDTATVVHALLIHDIGKLVSIDFTDTEFVEPRDRDHWEEVQRATRAAYGHEEATVTQRIADEVGLAPTVKDCLGTIGFHAVAARVIDPSPERKLCCYADMRVAPSGIVPIDERIRDAATRYAEDAFAETISTDLRTLERQIVAKTLLKPEDVTDAAIAPIVPMLMSSDVGTVP